MIYTLVTRDFQTITLDSITNVSESYTARATSFPVENGSPITDHIVLENNKFSISGVVCDYNIANPNLGSASAGTPVVFNVENNLFTGGVSLDESPIEKVKSLLVKTLKAREFVSFTRTDAKNNTLEEHINCVIVGLSFSDDPDGGEAIYPKIELEEIRLAVLTTEASKTVALPFADKLGNTAAAVGEDGKPLPDGKNKDVKEKTAAEKAADAVGDHLNEIQMQNRALEQKNKELAAKTANSQPSQVPKKQQNPIPPQVPNRTVLQRVGDFLTAPV